jgi:hypothetical protein
LILVTGCGGQVSWDTLYLAALTDIGIWENFARSLRTQSEAITKILQFQTDAIPDDEIEGVIFVLMTLES